MTEQPRPIPGGTMPTGHVGDRQAHTLWEELGTVKAALADMALENSLLRRERDEAWRQADAAHTSLLAVEAAVQAERAACAQLAEGAAMDELESEWDDGYMAACDAVARMIRERGSES